MTISIARTKSPRNSHGIRVSLLAALRVWAERRALSRMDASRLKDMGISAADAATESARSFWDLPNQTRC